MALDLQAVKVGGLKKNSAHWPTTQRMGVAQVQYPEDGTILNILWTATLQPLDLHRPAPAVPLLRDLKLF